MSLLTLLTTLVDLPSIVAGHGYDVGRESSVQSGVQAEDGGIGTLWIIGGVILLVVVLGLLVSISPKGGRARLKRLAPKAAILVVIAAPLIAWTASSGGAQERSLIVERWINDAGFPELIVSLGDPDLNDARTTSSRGSVRLMCTDDNDNVVIKAEQKWPFITEDGYKYPHAHQKAQDREQLEQVERCSLNGSGFQLEADVEGLLKD